MKVLFNLTKRNINLFFKDKAMFFTSMITPLILVLLYVTFLNVSISFSGSNKIMEVLNRVEI